MANFYDNSNEIERTEEYTPYEGTKCFFGLYSTLLMLSFILIIISIIGDVVAAIVVAITNGFPYFFLILAEIPLVICAVITWKLHKYASWAQQEHEELEERLDKIEQSLKEKQ